MTNPLLGANTSFICARPKRGLFFIAISTGLIPVQLFASCSWEYSFVHGEQTYP
jgi:hypothetical protein